MPITVGSKSEHQIFAAMAAIQADLDAIARDTEARGLPYTFRSADDVTNALHPLLVKHNVVCIPEASDPIVTDYTSGKGSRMLHVVMPVVFRYYTTDGSFVEARTIGEGADASDKSCNKAMTQARKAADCLAFTIPTGEADPEATRPELPEDAPPRPRKQGPLESLNRPLCNDKQRKMLYAVSMGKADKLMDEQAAKDGPLKHQETAALAGSIRKHAAVACNVDRDAICADEINPLKDCIERAEIDHEGDVTIPTKAF